MARRGMSEERRRGQAIQAGLRAISRGERPRYRIEPLSGGRWQVVGAEWLSLAGSNRRDAMDSAIDAIAAMLGVGPEAFNVEA